MLERYWPLIDDSPAFIESLSSPLPAWVSRSTQGFSKTHDRVGHVFQKRYKAILVQRDIYLL